MKGNIIVFLFIVLIFIVPLPHYWLLTSSFMSVTVLFLILFFFVKDIVFNGLKLSVNSFKQITFTFLFLMFHFLLTQFFVGEKGDFIRGISSIVLFVFMLINSYFFYRMIEKLDSKSIGKVVNIVLFLFVISFTGIYIPTIQNFEHLKPILPFNEPSHYALFALPFIFYKFFTIVGQMYRILFIAFWILIAILLQNLTLLTGLLLGLLIMFFKNKFIYIVLFIPILLPILINYIPSEYFASRLKFDLDNNNLSVLVFIQGWQLAYESFIETYGLGIGIQQLGFYPLDVEAKYIINKLLGQDVNLTDAGLTAPKLISEFGIFGVILIVCYIKYFLIISRVIKKENNRVRIFFYCIYLSFSIDLFIRGIGYFNPPFFLFLTSIFFISDNLTNHRKVS